MLHRSSVFSQLLVSVTNICGTLTYNKERDGFSSGCWKIGLGTEHHIKSGVHGRTKLFTGRRRTEQQVRLGLGRAYKSLEDISLVLTPSACQQHHLKDQAFNTWPLGGEGRVLDLHYVTG